MPLDPKILDDLSSRVSRLLPASARGFGEDMEKNVKAAVGAALARLDLVTREELEIQSAVLQRTRERLEQLEQRIARLETSPDTGQKQTPEPHPAAQDRPAPPPTPNH